MNIAAVIISPWYSAKIKNEPIFREVPFLGSEPNDCDNDSIIGYKTPPARAVLLGVAGAKIRSTPINE